MTESWISFSPRVTTAKKIDFLGIRKESTFLSVLGPKHWFFSRLGKTVHVMRLLCLFSKMPQLFCILCIQWGANCINNSPPSSATHAPNDEISIANIFLSIPKSLVVESLELRQQLRIHSRLCSISLILHVDVFITIFDPFGYYIIPFLCTFYHVLKWIFHVYPLFQGRLFLLKGFYEGTSFFSNNELVIMDLGTCNLRSLSFITTSSPSWQKIYHRTENSFLF